MNRLRFHKYDWVLVKEREYPSGYKELMYRVYRRYFGRLIPLSNTKQSYPISADRWEFYGNQLKKNPRFLPQMAYWSGILRK